MQVKEFTFFLFQLSTKRCNLRNAFLVLIILNVLCANVVYAQQSLVVTGKITDAQTGEAIPYATIFVKLKNGTVRATASDFDGLYHLAIPHDIANDLFIQRTSAIYRGRNYCLKHLRRWSIFSWQ
ncbi:hypothetical protein [Pedobacter sp. NJ-S-72]